MKTVGGSTEGLVNCLSPKEEDVDSEWVTVEIPRETEQGLCVCVCVCVFVCACACMHMLCFLSECTDGGDGSSTVTNNLKLEHMQKVHKE